MQPQNLFVNYTHPDQQGNRQQRQKVASYIGTYYRNRSRPLSRRKSAAKTDQGQTKNEAANNEQQQTSGMQVMAWRIKPQNASLLSTHDTYGFRADPFRSYPIPYTETLSRALDYFFGAYGPTHLVRSHLLRYKPNKNFLQRYVQYAMQDAAMFGSIVTLSLANMRITFWIGGQPDTETSRYYGTTLMSLRRSLSTDIGINEDATIMAIVSLMRFEYLVGNARAYRAHSAALRVLLARRGGVGEIGWREMVPAITGAISRSKFFLEVTKHASLSPLQTPVDADFDGLIPYSPPELPGRTLPRGIQLLADFSRLSETVVRLARATLRHPAIDIRHDNTAANNAYNTELTEYLEYILVSETLSLPNEILMISIHRELHDLAANERYSVLYRDFVTHWTERALQMVDEISPDDVLLVEMFIWLCFKQAGSMVAPFLNMMSDDMNDPRFLLMLRVMQNFWQAREWSTVEALLMRFGPLQECLYWWQLVWQKVRVQYVDTQYDHISYEEEW